jgi:isopentenyl phosphate kinase
VLEVCASVAALQTGVVNSLRDAGLPAVAVPASLLASGRGGRVRLRPWPVLELLDHGFHPVTGGDLVFDDRMGARVLSGDELLVLLARALQPRRAVYATDVDGVILDGRLALELPVPAVRRAVQRIPPGPDATGGMRGKLEAAGRLQRLGVDTWIVNGRRPGRFAAAVRGRPGVGTHLPAPRRI